MGIVNVTPDSFSDGGRFFDTSKAIDLGCQLIADGAAILDIGGESTRPGATPVDESEELRRVIPVVEALAGRAVVSIDTQKPAVARAALAAGASIVNDIAAHRSDPAMWQVVAEAGAAYVAMHMQGTPATMQSNPFYADVVREIGEFFEDRLHGLASVGVPRECVAIDPGFGFGKSAVHNLELLRRLGEFRRFDRPLVLGVSRKSFLGVVTGAETNSRVPAGIACSLWAASQGAVIHRTHDVAATVQALTMHSAIAGTAA